MASGIRLITYESEVTLKSGPHGCSVMAAPPTSGRDSSTAVRSPALARNAAATRPLWPPPTITASHANPSARHHADHGAPS